MKLGIQVFSVRDLMTNKDETLATFKKLKEFGFEVIQTAGLCGLTAEEYANCAKEAGLEICGTHDAIPDPDNILPTVEMHKILGTTNAGIGGYPLAWGQPINQEDVDKVIDLVNRIGKALAPYGMKFNYHHHSFEFAKVNGKTVMEQFVDGFDKENVTFVLDTCWLQHGGVNILEWLDKLKGRVEILHLKDRGVMNTGTNDSDMTELGNGNMNFPEIIKAAKAAGVEYLCYEQDYNWEKDPLSSAETSINYLKSIL